MKDREAAVKKEIKGRATALTVTFAVFDLLLILLLCALRNNTGAVITLLCFLVVSAAVTIVGILAIRNPMRFKPMFRNLKSEQKAQPRPQRKESGYRYDNQYGFISKLFSRAVSVSAGAASPDYVKQCVDFFQNLPEEQIERIVSEAEKYRREFYELSGDSGLGGMPEELNGRDILKWIYPKVMWIDEAEDGVMQFLMECDCEWEPEHGLEIVVYDRLVIHVGAYDGDIEQWKETYLSGI